MTTKEQRRKLSLRTDGTLECTKCHLIKPKESFYAVTGRCKHRENRDNQCIDCKSSVSKKWKKENQETVRVTNKRWRDNKKQQCLNHYGAECNWCGEKDVGTLTLDHVNNDGSIERENLGICWFWNHVVKQGFPNTYQILCMGCNAYKAWHGNLPESKRKLDIKVYSLAEYGILEDQH